jgi:DNA-directed RNA polymerase specialized sigma24 family protein
MILYCEEDLSYEQIAEAMATDIGTVKSRIHYARKNLVKLLRPEILEALGIKKEE